MNVHPSHRFVNTSDGRQCNDCDAHAGGLASKQPCPALADWPRMWEHLTEDLGLPAELEPSEKVCADLLIDAAHRKACRCST